MKEKTLVSLLFVILLVPVFCGCLGEQGIDNDEPLVEILYPSGGDVVSSLVMISGVAHDPDGDDTLRTVEVMIGDSTWEVAEGTQKWSYDWRTYEIDDGSYVIHVRSWDGLSYSEEAEVEVLVDNPKSIDSGAHKWAVFIAVANFPADNESKLGNGGLHLAEDMAEYFIENYDYSTSHIVILFDDGWIRKDNGYGERIETLQQRPHQYDITYGGATRKNVESTLSQVIKEANSFDDSEVFLWLFSHGCGDENDVLTGGKFLESSAVFLWDDIITDQELGDVLYDLQSKKTCIIVDACFSGGFADRIIYDFPSFFLLKSDIPSPGRVVMTGTSKYRVGYASTTRGPLFSLLWFEGITTGDADGFRSGIRETGRPTLLKLFKDGKVSVEEAFYYARYKLRTDQTLKEYKTMQPQINDQYPNNGMLRSYRGLTLG
jgi:hypothetical protein